MTSPKPVKLYRRRWTALIMLPVALMIAICSPYGILLFITFFGKEHVIAIAVVSAVCLLFLLIGISLIREYWRALTFNGPALVIDERGFTNYFDGLPTIIWRDIERIAIVGDDTDAIVIDVRNAQDAESTARSLFKLTRRLMQRANSSGDIYIYLGEIVYRRKELETQLRELHTWAARAQKPGRIPQSNG
jgi:hypothetical protein